MNTQTKYKFTSHKTRTSRHAKTDCHETRIARGDLSLSVSLSLAASIRMQLERLSICISNGPSLTRAIPQLTPRRRHRSHRRARVCVPRRFRAAETRYSRPSMMAGRSGRSPVFHLPPLCTYAYIYIYNASVCLCCDEVPLPEVSTLFYWRV